MAKEYNISKASGTCIACQGQLAPDQEFVAVVREIGQELRREDYCLPCWQGHNQDGENTPEVLGLWRARIPSRQEKKKLFIDDELLIDFFEQLGEAAEDSRLTLRYVLALVLMRKKLLVYDRMERLDDGREVWLMHFKASDQTHRVIDPKMDEDKIAEVSRQLGQVLEAQL